ncbi:MAG: PD-(D/E)XK nuclease family protein, partial [Pseudomonadota bacterium]
MSDPKEKHSFSGRITRIAAEPRLSKSGDYVFRGLEVLAAPDNKRVFVLIPESVCAMDREDLYRFPLLCREGAEMAAFGLVRNNELTDGTIIHMADVDTYLVLEPYRLVSVTDAVEAGMCLRSVDARYRMAADEPFWMAKGKMVHHLFDYLLAAEAAGREPSFNEAFQAARPALLEVLPGSAVSVKNGDLVEDAKRHFSNLKSWIDKTDLQNTGVLVEADGMSSVFGIKGRADAILSRGDSRTIIELKTGRQVMDDHLVQLYAYSLLFTDTESDPIPEGVVFYSGTGAVRKLRRSERPLVIEGRNRVIALKNSYTRPVDGSPSALFDETCPRTGKCFQSRACSTLYPVSDSSALGALGPEAQEYYTRWFTSLSKEINHIEGEFAAILNPNTLHERVTAGITVGIAELSALDEHVRIAPGAPLEADADSNTPDMGYALKRAKRRIRFILEEKTVEFGAGEEIILHPGDPCSGRAMRGIVEGTREGVVTAAVSLPRNCRPGNGDEPTPIVLDGVDTAWYVDRVPFLRGPELARQALLRFLLSADPGLVGTVRPECTKPGVELSEAVTRTEMDKAPVKDGKSSGKPSRTRRAASSATGRV